MAPSLGVELIPVDARDAGEIERAVTALSRAPWAQTHRSLIITLAARYNLPAVYASRYYARWWLDVLHSIHPSR
jgi:putative tryptophan/tyrosine transport system substrate-binding protein